MKTLLDKIERYHSTRHLIGKVDAITAQNYIKEVDRLSYEIAEAIDNLEGSDYDTARNAFLAL